MNSIIWRGVPSTDIEGLLICELPPITKPQMRTKETIIDGRDGSIIEELGYEPYDKPLVIGLHGNYDIDRIMKYFTGEGEVVFSNEPDKVYMAKISGKIDYTRLLRFRQATITFRVQPYKFKKDEDASASPTATASGTNLVLKDSGNALMQITTEAESVIVHGKNLVNASDIDVSTNKSINVYDDGYKIVIVGGTSGVYTAARYYLPMETKGKTYTLKCDDITSGEVAYACAQVKITTSGETEYYSVFSNAEKRSIDFTVPEDAVSIGLGIYTNHTNTILPTDNTATVFGLRIVPAEFKNDEWCAFDGLQTLEVVDGVAKAKGYEPVTVISNADNVEMSVEYFKPFEVVNEGLEESKPIMSLRGSGTVEILVNGLHTFTYTFPEGENEVVIDSEKEDAYMGGFLKNRNMNGEFPILQAGTNKIEWNGDIDSITIQPRSRWL